MSDQEQLDAKLAKITDMLLANKQPLLDDTEDIESEVAMVRLLQSTIAPREDVSAQFRQRLTSKLNEEWEQKQRRQQSRRILPFRLSSQILAAASVGLFIGVAIVLTVFNGEVEGNSVPGTVVGDATSTVFIAMGLGIVVVLAFLVWSKKR